MSQTEGLRYLETLDLILINRHLCLQQPQSHALLSLAGLQHVVARPQLCIDGYEPFPGLWEKAAVLLDSLLQEKPFLHHNGLTGFVAAVTLLELNGEVRHSQPDDLEQIKSISMHQLTIPQIAEWLQRGSF